VFGDWLRAFAPSRADKVLRALREMFGDRVYDSRFGVRGRGRGPRAELLRRRFEIASRRCGLGSARLELDATKFRVPRAVSPQPGLFDERA
jgi:hypothetical protein